MDKNTTIAFILIGAILVIWLFMNTPEQKRETNDNKDTTTVVEKKTEDSLKIKKEGKKPEIVIPEKKEENEYGIFSNSVVDTGRTITIATDLAIYELSTR
ncbi:MAG: hypothetical protein OQK63_09275, partial [Ignavibacteriaceae bacterium]|nr:hypothetical protein [Ignavibacteriaceae bacterium]